MNNSTISILRNKTFLNIINETKLFLDFKINFYSNIDLFLNENKKELVIVFENDLNELLLNYVKNFNLPIIILINSTSESKYMKKNFLYCLETPFKFLDLKKKIIFLLAKSKFRENSLIKLKDYIIDKNERKIIKKDLSLQLSEKEINFLILFSESNKPISKNLVLKQVWNYSEESETHTVETHIHRLRKKIYEKFGDNKFIKNNKSGYYI